MSTNHLSLHPLLSLHLLYKGNKGNLRRLSCRLDGELKHDVLARELLVDSSEGLKLMLCGVPLLGVKEDLEDLGAVSSVPDSLADDLGGVDEVVEDLVVNLKGWGGSERVRSGL